MIIIIINLTTFFFLLLCLRVEQIISAMVTYLLDSIDLQFALLPFHAERSVYEQIKVPIRK